MIPDFLFRLVQDDLSSFGDVDMNDDLPLDVQTITDAMMTTAQKVAELGIRFALNLLVCWILVHCFYYRKSRRRDYYFTFMIFSSAMLTLLYIMGNVEVGVGLTLGLFAIFGVIRYRTETVPIREMTYLFVIIALAAANGLAPIYNVVDVATTPHYALGWGNVGVMSILSSWCSTTRLTSSCPSAGKSSSKTSRSASASKSRTWRLATWTSSRTPPSSKCTITCPRERAIPSIPSPGPKTT